jgi:hypothetical protein
MEKGMKEKRDSLNAKPRKYHEDPLREQIMNQAPG